MSSKGVLTNFTAADFAAFAGTGTTGGGGGAAGGGGTGAGTQQQPPPPGGNQPGPPPPPEVTFDTVQAEAEPESVTLGEDDEPQA